MSDREHTIELEIEADGASYCSRVSVSGAEPWRFRIDEGFLRPGNPVQEKLARIADGEVTPQDLIDVGAALFAAAFGGVVPKRSRGPHRKAYAAVSEVRRAQIDEGDHLVLRLRPGPLSHLPWEALYDAEQGHHRLGTHPRCSLIRTVGQRPTAPRETSELRMLIAIPAHSGLDVDEEANRILKLAENAARFRVQGTVLRKGVTVSRIREALEKDAYDVFHFVGHGELDEARQVTIGLNDREQGPTRLSYVPVDTFLGPFQSDRYEVPLVVLNCCLAGTPRGHNGLAGLAPRLIVNGASSVVAMGYKIADPMAAVVAEAFYKALFSGPRAGRPDVAIQAARLAIQDKLGAPEEVLFGPGAAEQPPSPREVVNPILYQRPGDPRLFVPPEEPQPAAGPALRPAVAPGLELPSDLVQAAHLGLIVPVLGPGLFRSRGPAPHRDGEAPLALSLAGALVSDLARQGQRYPEAEEVEIRGPAWTDAVALPRLCSHYLRQRGHRYALTNLAVQWVQGLGDPPRVLGELARWRGLPGVVCTSFDRAVRAAFRDAGREVVVFPRIDGPPASAAAPAPGVPLLVFLRGTADAHDSLVLTEQDHDDLWDRISRIRDEVKGLLTAVPGRSLLFLGVSPRDPWTRHFARALLRLSPNIGPAFFVDPHATPVDEASWTFDRAPVAFVRAPPEDVLWALSDLLARGAA